MSKIGKASVYNSYAEDSEFVVRGAIRENPMRSAAGAAIATALAASPAAVQTAADQIDQLRLQLDALQQRINELESRQQQAIERAE